MKASCASLLLLTTASAWAQGFEIPARRSAIDRQLEPLRRIHGGDFPGWTAHREQYSPSFVRHRTDSRAGETFVNSIGMKLVGISAGEFTMGSPPHERGRRDDEVRRRVKISNSYFIGKFEVTRGQFRQFVDATGYKTEPERGGRGGYGYDATANKLAGPNHQYSWRFTGFEQTDEHPVVNVTWNDAVAFCRWLSEREKKMYRLPTEAEWEFACRGGSMAAYTFGDDPEQLAKVGNVMDALAHEKFLDRLAIAGRDGFVFTAPVGSFLPNIFGLHDLHGNVWEWTADWFEIPDTSPQVDPQGPSEGRDKVVRGGDWYHDWSFARSAQRYPIHPGLCRRHAGFRVVQSE